MSIVSIDPDQHQRESSPEAEGDGQHQPLPPQDPAAEQSVLGALMLSKEAITEVSEVLRAEHFYRPGHAALYDCVLEMFLAGKPADPVTVAGELERRGELVKLGGAAYLHTLLAACHTATNAGFYAEQVVDAATRRTVIGLGATLSTYASRGGADTGDILDQAQTRLAEVVDSRATNSTGATLGALIQPTMDEMDELAVGGGRRGVPTGFTELDELTGGLHAGELVTIAARTGVGKSVLATDIARAAAIHSNIGTLMFSLEMGQTELVMRMIAAEARVRLGDIRSGKLTDDDWTRAARRMGEISEAPLVIDDGAAVSSMDISGRSRRWQRVLEQQGTPLGLIIVDYLQLMTGTKRVESRQQEVSEFSRALKLLAKSLEVPVVALSQLNRGPEQRSDKRPLLSDLRESGAIEQDSDKVILIHRPDAFDRDERAGEADLILAKHRGGATTTCTVAHQLHISRFTDMVG